MAKLFVAKLVATCGVGFINKGAGTAASVLPAVCWYFFQPNFVWQSVLIVAIMVLGVWSAAIMNKVWKHDDNRIVIDEVLGMAIAIFSIPLTAVNIFIGLFLFRFFDIVKPLGVRKMEKIKGGWGVMMDDVLAGVYANIVLQLLLWVKLN